MAPLLNVPKSDWKALFDRMSKTLTGKRAEIEVASLDLGDQIVAEWVPLLGITYDSNDDVVDVALETGSHVIREPREIAIQEGPDGLETVAVVDGEGTRQVVRLKEPLAHPGRHAGSSA